MSLRNGCLTSRSGQLGCRLYYEFCMPSRLPKYEELLTMLVRGGYECVTFREFASAVAAGQRVPWQRAALLRHDIDSDVCTARAMFDLERKFCIRSTYYFRLETVDVRLMHELEANGCEAGYHYEEIATFAKRMGIRTPEGVSARMDEVRALFRTNLIRLREMTGLPIRTIAAHGDFANRKLKMTNIELLDPTLRRELSIEAEAYDNELEKHFTVRVSDAPPPAWWRPCDPRPHIRNGSEVVHVLVHPGQWRSARRANFLKLCRRCGEGLAYWARSRRDVTPIR